MIMNIKMFHKNIRTKLIAFISKNKTNIKLCNDNTIPCFKQLCLEYITQPYPFRLTQRPMAPRQVS